VAPGALCRKEAFTGSGLTGNRIVYGRRFQYGEVADERIKLIIGQRKCGHAGFRYALPDYLA
jgi:hypothetical protein